MKKVTIITCALFAGIGLSMSHLATAAPSQTQTDLSSLDATTHELMGDNGLDRFRDFMQGNAADAKEVTRKLMADNGLDRFRDFMQGGDTDSSDS